MRALIAIWIAAACATVARADKTTISVMDLNVTSGVSAGEAVMLTDKLLNELVNNGAYKVVERSKRDEILKEQGFQQTGACDQGRCLVEAGQLLGVQKMVGGTIGRLGAVYAVELRIMDVKTGEIDRAFSRKYKGDVSKLLDAMQEAAADFSGSGPGSATGTTLHEPSAGTPAVSGPPRSAVNGLGYREVVNEKDGSVLIEIPAGKFLMGSDSGSTSQQPAHLVHLNKYAIGRHEVTVGQYKRFCKAVRRDFPDQPPWNNEDDQPVVNVNWSDAQRYCAWAGLRLPTEAEWEKAARGTDGRKYPWGDRWIGVNCNHGIDSWIAFEDTSDGFRFTAPVAEYPDGASPYGCLNMAGNVYEWCGDWFDDSYYRSSPDRNPMGPSQPTDRRVCRGGSYYCNPEYCSSILRSADKPGVAGKGVGFRVAQ
ncbi:MAG: SUMF1/EgtB/PvdO family nonheme iron enzyme [Candidatus Edwardsbacteria bacterium]|jgi:formylglycine-generating enzyme required for sulfatase activity|nr:SUMF1/EgtB/PvdO family nonheme iron enzyme [Candidatus Edwardsbacteria bacterium]